MEVVKRRGTEQHRRAAARVVAVAGHEVGESGLARLALDEARDGAVVARDPGVALAVLVRKPALQQRVRGVEHGGAHHLRGPAADGDFTPSCKVCGI